MSGCHAFIGAMWVINITHPSNKSQKPYKLRLDKPRILFNVGKWGISREFLMYREKYIYF